AYLKSLRDAQAREIVQALEPLAQQAPPPAIPDDALEWTEVQRMQESGMQMAAHGVRHGILTRMSPEEARRELADGLQGVRQRGGPVRDLLVLLIVAAVIPLSLYNPFYGLLGFSWLAYMRPQDLSWGLARDLPLSKWVALAIYGSLLLRGKFNIFRPSRISFA